MSPANADSALSRIGSAWQGWTWASRELAQLRTTLGTDGLDAAVTPPPTVEAGSLRGTRAALDLRRATCLERSLIMQAWLAARGLSREIIVGVRRAHVAKGDQAHAWIDGFDDDCSSDYAEIRRVPAPPVT